MPSGTALESPLQEYLWSLKLSFQWGVGKDKHVAGGFFMGSFYEHVQCNRVPVLYGSWFVGILGLTPLNITQCRPNVETEQVDVIRKAIE